MVFQNPYASLNPRVKLFEALEEPVRVHNPGMALEDVGDKVLSVMAAVGLDPAVGWLLPTQLFPAASASASVSPGR